MQAPRRCMAGSARCIGKQAQDYAYYPMWFYSLQIIFPCKWVATLAAIYPFFFFLPVLRFFFRPMSPSLCILFSSLLTCGASAPPPSAPRRPSGAVQQHALASSPTPSPNTCETPFLAKSWLWIVSFRRSIISSKGIFRQSLVDNALTSFDLSVLSSNPHCQR